MKTILIDANNLIHKIPHLKKNFEKEKESAQISLVEAVKSRLSGNDKAIFVFDGFGKSRYANVIFSRERTADDLIREKIEKFKDHRKLKVVSSDLGFTGFAKVCGCEVQKSEDFWNEIIKPDGNQNPLTSGKNINQNYIYDKKEKPERMNKKEVEEFRKYFT